MQVSLCLDKCNQTLSEWPLNNVAKVSSLVGLVLTVITVTAAHFGYVGAWLLRPLFFTGALSFGPIPISVAALHAFTIAIVCALVAHLAKRTTQTQINQAPIADREVITTNEQIERDLLNLQLTVMGYCKAKSFEIQKNWLLAKVLDLREVGNKVLDKGIVNLDVFGDILQHMNAVIQSTADREGAEPERNMAARFLILLPALKNRAEALMGNEKAAQAELQAFRKQMHDLANLVELVGRKTTAEELQS